MRVWLFALFIASAPATWARAEANHADEASLQKPEVPRVAAPFELKPDGTVRRRPRIALSMGFGVGGANLASSTDVHGAGFFVYRGDVTLLFKRFSLGLLAEAGGTGSSYNGPALQTPAGITSHTVVGGASLFAGVTGGPAWNFHKHRLELRGEFGVHAFSVGGPQYDVSSVTAVAPAAGAGVWYQWAASAFGRVSFLLTLGAYVRYDLGRTTVTPDRGAPLTVGGSMVGVSANGGILF